MSKYIIDIPDNVKKIVYFHLGNANAVWTTSNDLDDLEQLNSDYINEHFGDLQDTAYQRGFEDGKAVNDKGCEGCKYEGNPNDNPCKCCSNGYPNQWTSKSDKIEVGDEVTASGELKCIVTVADYSNDVFYVLFSDGSCGKKSVDTLEKTGRHFDIASILEDMRND